MKLRSFYLNVTASAFATAIAVIPATAYAQSIVPPQIPLADTQCNGGTFFNQLYSCDVRGTRTHSTPEVTITPSSNPALSKITHTEDVRFDGTLIVGGATLPTQPNSFFGSLPQFIFQTDDASVSASMSYTGSTSILVPTQIASLVASQFDSPLGQFSQYDIHSLNVRSIDVDYRNQNVTPASGGDYYFNLSSTNPTAVRNNTTALSGNYRGSNEDGTLVFGKISGNAKVLVAEPNGAVITASPAFPNPDGSPSSVFVSPIALQYEVTSEETTRLDENGLITPTIAVTDGINMNGSRITNLGNAVNAGDAVNLGQVTQLIASSSPVQRSDGNGALSGGSGSSASGNGAVALGLGQQATGNGAVAIGDPNIAAGQGAVAIGADNTSTGTGAIALGDRNTASGSGAVAIGLLNDASAQGAVAIGARSSATNFGNVAVGFNADATAAASTAVGSLASASADRTTAIGRGATASAAGASALGYVAEASGANSTAIGTRAVASATGSVALGHGSVADQANTVSVGSAGSERRVVNVAAAVNATDAVNKAQFDAESAQRQAAEALLQTNLVAEAETRAAADVTLQNAVNSEAATRATAVASLQTGLSTETAARVAADNAEANARLAAENRLQTQINAIGTNLFSLTGRVTTLENTVKQDRRDARQGIAAAVAMTAAPMPSAPGKVAYTVNVANFRDEQAVAASLAMRLRGPSTMAVTAGVSYGGGANTAVRVGVAGEF